MNSPDPNPPTCTAPPVTLRTEAPTPAHVLTLSETLREADLLEFQVRGHADLPVLIRQSIAMSDEAFSVLEGDILLYMVGVARHPVENTGIPWMLTSGAFKRDHFLAGLEDGRAMLARWVSTYGLLFNLVHEDNKQPQEWLKRMGFHVPDAPTYTAPNGAQFRVFSMGAVQHV